MPVRKVVTRSGRRVRGYFPSQKAGRMIQWESQLERDALHLIERSPGVLGVEEQAEQITYIDGEMPRKYILDFEATLANEKTIPIEVKPAVRLKRRKERERYVKIACHYSQQGQNFRILTDEEIRVEPRLSNLKLLSYHNRTTGGDLGSLDDMRALLELLPAKTVGGASAVLGGLANVYRLLAQGFLTCDLDQPISEHSEIKYLKEGEINAALHF